VQSEQKQDGANMAKQWEITGRLGELQLEWLRANYPEEVLAETLRKLPKKGYPLNVARKLEREPGGKRMPSPAELLANDPESQQRAAAARDAAIDRVKALARALRSSS
jgi:hypothetical protein